MTAKDGKKTENGKQKLALKGNSKDFGLS